MLGVGVPLEARALGRALRARPALPPNCFLSVNVSPALLGDPMLRRTLTRAGDLAGTVVEITEGPADNTVLLAHVEWLRSRGAVIALDDAGAGHTGLRRIADVRPDMVKLDRTLVHGIAQEPVLQALVETVGGFVGRLDGWLVAEGVECQDDLLALAAMGVPLAQGFLLGRPSGHFPELAPRLAGLLRSAAAERAGRAVGAELVRGAAQPLETMAAEGVGGPGVAPGRSAVLTDEVGRPVGLRIPRQRTSAAPVTVVQAGESLLEVARRLVARPHPRRLDPAVGLLPLDVVLSRLVATVDSGAVGYVRPGPHKPGPGRREA